MKNFNMALCKAVSTPIGKYASALLRAEAVPEQVVPYRDVIGGLLYFAMCTSPDISYAVQL